CVTSKPVDRFVSRTDATRRIASENSLSSCDFTESSKLNDRVGTIDNVQVSATVARQCLTNCRRSSMLASLVMTPRPGLRASPPGNGCPHFRDTIVPHDVSKQKSLFFESNKDYFSDGTELDMAIRNVLSKARYDVCKF